MNKAKSPSSRNVCVTSIRAITLLQKVKGGWHESGRQGRRQRGLKAELLPAPATQRHSRVQAEGTVSARSQADRSL